MKSLTALLGITMILSGLLNTGNNFALADSSLPQQLSGRILLQVESHGEAWYVEPTSLQRVYLKDGNVAYQALRDFGLGITNADLSKIPIGVEKRFTDVDTDNDGLADTLETGIGTDPTTSDTDNDGYSDSSEILEMNTNPIGTGTLHYDQKLEEALSGRILLQVESHGEAWYVNPADKKRYYMTDGDAAYQIMRFLSLGITTTNLGQIAVKKGYGLYDTQTEHVLNSENQNLFPIDLQNNLSWEINLEVTQSSDHGLLNAYFNVTRKMDSTKNYSVSVKTMRVDTKTGIAYEVAGDSYNYVGWLSGEYLVLNNTHFDYPNLRIGRRSHSYKIPITINTASIEGLEQTYSDTSSIFESKTQFSVAIKGKDVNDTACLAKGINYSPYNVYYTWDSKLFKNDLLFLRFRCFSSEQEAIDNGYRKALDN